MGFQYETYATAFNNVNLIGNVYPVEGYYDKETFTPKVVMDSGNRMCVFALKVPHGKKSIFIPIKIFNNKTKFFVENIKFSDTVSVLGYIDTCQVELTSWNGEPRKRDYFDVVLVDIKNLYHLGIEEKSEKTVPWIKNPDEPKP